MTERTIFDLASLTKPMVTAPLLVELTLSGALGLDDPLERHLEETRGTRVGSLTLRSLLTHTSGLPAMNPLEDYRGGKPRLYAAIAREDRGRVHGATVRDLRPPARWAPRGAGP